MDLHYQMKILYLNLNILDVKCDGRDNTEDQCSCISFVVPSKTEWLGKSKRKQHGGYYMGFPLPIGAFN